MGVAVTNLRVVCKNHYVCFSFTEMAMFIFLGIVKAAAGLDTLCCWLYAIILTTGKNTRLFGVLDQNETRFFTNVYVSQRVESKATTVVTSD